MRVILDAQLIAGYFRESVHGEPPAYSASAVELVDRLGTLDTAIVDDGGLIEQEYQELLDVEWLSTTR